MRIVAGTLGGRTIQSPRTHTTHPMSEKMRGAIFNALGDLQGLEVLDAFGGSGALGIEAISRGAAHAVVIERDKSAQKIIEQNIAALHLENSVKLITGNARSWSNNNRTTQFDVVLCDPPYDKIQEELLEKLAWHVKPGGIIVFSLPVEARIILPEDTFEVRITKSYGTSQLRYYKRFRQGDA